MAKKDKKVPNELPIKYFYPEFHIDPLQKAVWEVEKIIINSGLPYNMKYRPDDGYFSVELYNGKKEN